MGSVSETRLHDALLVIFVAIVCVDVRGVDDGGERFESGLIPF